MSTHTISVVFDGREYQVELEETGPDSLRVVVNGQVHQVSLKRPPGISAEKPAPQATFAPASQPAPPPPGSPPASSLQSNLVTAPMPGDIAAISVKPGEGVEIGQELLVLEAMKMKNVIRAPRAGKVTGVEVSVGQSVKFGDPLVRFE